MSAYFRSVCLCNKCNIFFHRKPAKISQWHKPNILKTSLDVYIT
uniref:Uncharacterized protein n=1 Tax=Anguilla anguilla TaxID=7936 RepID=A0A0E9RZA1_ANGAN